MSYCINPSCSTPQNQRQPLYCITCGSKLLLEDCYRVIRPLASGGFGDTYEVDDSGIKKVLKVLHNTAPKAIELFEQEAQVLAQLDHPGIPKVEPNGYFLYYTRTNQPIHCLIMEKIDGMTLEDYLKQNNYQPISERAAIRWLKQIVEILQEIHNKNYFHRDIKPPNIMLRENGQLVLIDFGTAREMTQTYLQRLQGQQVTGIISGGYTPMEQVRGSAVSQSDFFALGRTFVFLLTGKNPDELTEDVNNGMLIWRNQAGEVSSQLADLLDNMMGVFPNNRPDNTQVILQVLNTIGSGLKTNNNVTPSPVKNIYSSSPSPVPTVVSSPVSNAEYAGFWKRLFAYLIDILILGIFSVIITLVCLYVFRNQLIIENDANFGDYFRIAIPILFVTIGEIFGIPFYDNYHKYNNYYNYYTYDTYDNYNLFLILIWLLIKYFYFAKLESSDNQGTFGKIILGIKVTDLKGDRISFRQASARFWRKNFSVIILFIGYMMAGWTKKKQALHDKISGTLVVNDKELIIKYINMLKTLLFKPL